MTNGQHIILCGCIELVGGIIDLSLRIYPASWILLGLGTFTILGGLAVHKKEEKK